METLPRQGCARQDMPVRGCFKDLNGYNGGLPDSDFRQRGTACSTT